MTTRTPVQLRNSTIAHLPGDVEGPGYDRSGMIPGVVHIGVGGFNRSHLAVYLDDLLKLGATKPWGEFGVGLLPADATMHAALAEQDFLYGLLLVDSGEESYRVVDRLRGTCTLRSRAMRCSTGSVRRSAALFRLP